MNNYIQISPNQWVNLSQVSYIIDDGDYLIFYIYDTNVKTDPAFYSQIKNTLLIQGT